MARGSRLDAPESLHHIESEKSGKDFLDQLETVHRRVRNKETDERLIRHSASLAHVPMHVSSLASTILPVVRVVTIFNNQVGGSAYIL